MAGERRPPMRRNDRHNRKPRSRAEIEKAREERLKEQQAKALEDWRPVTELGKKVKAGKIKDIDEALKSKILESEIVDLLLKTKENILNIGQAKGKFGGGQRRIFRQTQKKTREGNRIKFATCALVGNGNGYVGLAFGKSKETVPARDKSIRKAKLNLIKVRRGCGSWEGVADANSIPFAVEGKCGSIKVQLMPAPKGTGLCIEKECAKILSAAGIKDVWSKTKGQTKTKVNMVKACFDALKKLSEIKIQENHIHSLGIQDGKLKAEE